MSQNDLNALLTSSRALTSQLSRPDLPSVHLSLDQIEAQSRRLISRQQGAESDKANYLLAQAQVDASTLGNSIANLNTSTIFQPLQPLADTDVSGFLKHAHEQTILSSIEEGRRDTQAEFYRVLEERIHRDWEGRRKRILDQFGVRAITAAEPSVASQLRQSIRGLTSSRSVYFTPNLQMRAKMNAYTRVVAELNSTRLTGASFPIIQALKQAAQLISERSPFIDMLNVLACITQEPPGLQAISRAGVHMLNAPMFERKFARMYAQGTGQNAAVTGRAMRIQIARGAREALEQQYWDVISQTVHSHPQQASLGGDPSARNYVRAYCTVRFLNNGKWDERLELVGNTPLWARLYFLIRTGKVEEALSEANDNSLALNARDRHFTQHLQTWAESEDRKLPKATRDRLLASYNSHVLHAPTTDPFKLALYKLIGKLDPTKRTVAVVNSGVEDWLWFQLAMADEDDGGIGLRELSDVVLGYGERYFEPQKGGIHGMWARVLLLCGAFEQAVAALNDKPEFQVEATHLAIALAYHGLLRVPESFEASEGDILVLTPGSPAALNLSLAISRYVRPIMQSDPKEALEYIACICLTCDQSDTVDKEQMELAWEQTRRIVVSLDSDAKWELMVGGFRADGTRISGIIEVYMHLLHLGDTKAYYDRILLPAAAEAERDGRVNEAIKLYNLAGSYDTVVTCLARVLGDAVAEPTPGSEALEATAREIIRHYERTNRAAGRDRGVVLKLLNAREARACRDVNRIDRALELMEAMELVPLNGDQTAIRRAGEALVHQDDAISRNLGYFLQMMMELLKQHRDALRHSSSVDPHRLALLRKKATAIQSFAGALRGKRLSPDVYEHISRMAVDIAL